LFVVVCMWLQLQYCSRVCHVVSLYVRYLQPQWMPKSASGEYVDRTSNMSYVVRLVPRGELRTARARALLGREGAPASCVGQAHTVCTAAGNVVDVEEVELQKF
jgi:hypothetical protein